MGWLVGPTRCLNVSRREKVFSPDQITTPELPASSHITLLTTRCLPYYSMTRCLANNEYEKGLKKTKCQDNLFLPQRSGKCGINNYIDSLNLKDYLGDLSIEGRELQREVQCFETSQGNTPRVVDFCEFQYQRFRISGIFLIS